MISDPDNLLIYDALQLPESLAGKMVLSADGSTAYAISDYGFLILPLGMMSQSPLARATGLLWLLDRRRATGRCPAVRSNSRRFSGDRPLHTRPLGNKAARNQPVSTECWLMPSSQVGGPCSPARPMRNSLLNALATASEPALLAHRPETSSELCGIRNRPAVNGAGSFLLKQVLEGRLRDSETTSAAFLASESPTSSRNTITRAYRSGRCGSMRAAATSATTTQAANANAAGALRTWSA